MLPVFNKFSILESIDKSQLLEKIHGFQAVILAKAFVAILVKFSSLVGRFLN